MNILLHTIALEPARWTSQRVSQALLELLPRIAATKFRQLEIYEPHLLDADRETVRVEFARLKLVPVVLSSYLNSNPDATSDSDFERNANKLVEQINYYGFRKVRLFPAPQMGTQDRAKIGVFVERVTWVAGMVPDVQVLLETHDGSLADDPKFLADLVERMALANVGMLFQPTFFAEPDRIRDQFRIQKHLIRHFHLQNRHVDLSMATLKEGLVPWPEMLRELPDIDATIEFVPAGICPIGEFDLEATLQQAASEADYVRSTCKCVR